MIDDPHQLAGEKITEIIEKHAAIEAERIAQVTRLSEIVHELMLRLVACEARLSRIESSIIDRR